jgi:multidrug efflux pump subunit AcrB
VARLRASSSRGRRSVERWIERFRDAYVRGQQRVLRHRYAFLAACLAALYFSYWGVRPLIPVDLFPSDFDDLFVTLQTPTDFGVDQTNEVVRELEAEVAAMGGEIARFTTFVGMGFTADQQPIYSSSYGILFATLRRTSETADDPHAVFARVRNRLEAFAASRPGQIENLLVQTPRHGPPIGTPVAVRIQADDYGVAKRIAAEIKAELASMPGVFNIEDNVPEGPLELQVALDEHRASLHGLTFEDVAVALRAANDGLVSSTFKDPRSEEDVDIRVLLEASQRADMADLLAVEIRAPQGYRVKLGEVARLDVSRGYQRLYHFDARRSVVVYADVDNRNATSEAVNADLEARFADIPQRFAGVNLVFGGEAEQTRQTFDDARRALGVALLVIYAILATLFRSYLQPLVVMSVVAFAFIGVFLGLFVTGGSISMWVLYAGVGLAGIVVNDSLVLLDFVNQEQGRGTPIDEAVRIASFRRFRPILLTTLTTIAGLLPMALGLTGKSLVFGPFATAIVFGLLVASGLTLFVVPALYLTFEDVHARFGIRSRRRPTPPPATGPGTATWV